MFTYALTNRNKNGDDILNDVKIVQGSHVDYKMAISNFILYIRRRHGFLAPLDPLVVDIYYYWGSYIQIHSWNYMQIVCFVFFKKKVTDLFLYFWWTIILLWGHWYPCFGFWWRVLWVSKPEWVLPYLYLSEVYIICSLRSTSGATCADLLAAGSTASHFSTCISRGGTWLGFEQMITHTEGEHATFVTATRLACEMFNLNTRLLISLSSDWTVWAGICCRCWGPSCSTGGRFHAWRNARVTAEDLQVQRLMQYVYSSDLRRHDV